MNKIRLFYLLAICLMVIASACKKDDEPTPDPIVGRWTLDRIVLSNVPTAYQNYARTFTPSFWGLERYRYNFRADKTFTREIGAAVITTAEGDWELNNEQTTLKLTYDNTGTTQDLTLNTDKTELSYFEEYGSDDPINFGTAEEPILVTGRATYYFIKQ